jgi:type II secretory pathway pseudopilin PulG
MGQQQLLLIVLSIIIVGIAIYVGFYLLASNKADHNRQAVISDLLNYANKAQQYYRTPAQMGGGSLNFQGFHMSAIDTGNANGSYSVASGAAPSTAGFVPGSVAPISSKASTMYIIGCGKERGENKSTPVKCYIEVTADNFQADILN